MLAAEHVVRSSPARIHTVTLRLAGAYDEVGRAAALTEQMRRIHEADLDGFVFPGSTRRGQPFVHVDDVASAVLAAVERRRTLPRRSRFLVAEPVRLTYSQLQSRIGKMLLGREWPKLLVDDARPAEKQPPRAPSDPALVDLADADYPIAIGHTCRGLDWDPAHRLEDDLPEIVESLLRDPRSWYEANAIAFDFGMPHRDRARTATSWTPGASRATSANKQPSASR